VAPIKELLAAKLIPNDRNCVIRDASAPVGNVPVGDAALLQLKTIGPVKALSTTAPFAYVTVNRVAFGQMSTACVQPFVAFTKLTVANVPSGEVVLSCDSAQPVQPASGDTVVVVIAVVVVVAAAVVVAVVAG
jgi:hypothetical protein